MKKLNLFIAIILVTAQGFSEEKIALDNSKKYSACNQWIQDEFSNDKQFSLDPDTGEVIKGVNATQYFSQTSDKKNTQISFIKKSIADRDKNESLDYDIIENDDKTITIKRQHKFHINFPTSSDFGPGYRNPFGYINPLGYGALMMQNRIHSKAQAPSELSTDKVLTLALGKNGKCFIKESVVRSVNYPDISYKNDTELCHKIYKFYKKYPNIKQCTQENIFKELSNILKASDQKRQTNQNIKQVFGEIKLVINEQMALINESLVLSKGCSLSRLDDFVRDEHLFNSPIKAPVNLKSTKVKPEN